jgi:hypothetical protein
VDALCLCTKLDDFERLCLKYLRLCKSVSRRADSRQQSATSRKLESNLKKPHEETSNLGLVYRSLWGGLLARPVRAHSEFTLHEYSVQTIAPTAF